MTNSHCLCNKGITNTKPLIAPQALFKKLPIPAAIYHTIATNRKEIEALLRGDDTRFLLIIGPCSIHDPSAAFEYAKKLLTLRKKYKDMFYIIMRTYFEKPRTCIGWRGLIADPSLNGTSDIESGLIIARKLLLDIAAMGIPAASELLDPIISRYIADLISWASIGARSAESQIHRELASGLSMPVGFKNATNGALDSAINGIISAKQPHTFLGIMENGYAAAMHTTGNKYAHLVLRGGAKTTNYDRKTIEKSCAMMKNNSIRPTVLIDCSHGNSQKNHLNQKSVFLHSLKLRYGNQPIHAIRGCMLESFLQAGCTNIALAHQPESYGMSITDPCISWEMTESLLETAAFFVQKLKNAH